MGEPTFLGGILCRVARKTAHPFSIMIAEKGHKRVVTLLFFYVNIPPNS
jgi:hypothetical protein